MIRKIIHGFSFVFEFFTMMITMVIPKDKKMIIFGAWWGNKYDDNSRALYEYIIKNRPDIKAYWLTPNKSIATYIRSLGYPVVYSHTIKAILVTMRAGYECYCTSRKDIGENLVRYLGGCTLINLFHGVATKKILYDDKVYRGPQRILGKMRLKLHYFATKNIYVVCTSESYATFYKSAFRTSSDKVLNIGQARNDYFFMNTPNQYKEEFAGKKIIVYMPTHRQEGRKSMNMYHILDLPSINTILERHNAILIIKKHFYHRTEPSVGEEYNNIIENTNNNPETSELLKAADILITDYSSCSNDFLLLNRPQIFFCYDMEDYIINDRELYFDFYANVPGPICKNNSELIKELDKVLSGVDNYKEKRQQRLDFFYSKENQGIVAPRQLETILSL
jgi:Putative glycosyl/glycerophosphate transferases involved in teichoic acid biosynthesis TagF/TagB/EpsJ/RodC